MNAIVGAEGGEDLFAVISVEDSAIEEGDQSSRFTDGKDGAAEIHQSGGQEIEAEPVLADGFVIADSGTDEGMLERGHGQGGDDDRAGGRALS